MIANLWTTICKLSSLLWSKPLFTEDVYRKDSMDRFGDDMLELILSYLSVEDKFRFECVSKQWKRCVFEKQFEFDISLMKKQNSLNKLFTKNRHLSRRTAEICSEEVPEPEESETLHI